MEYRFAFSEVLKAKSDEESTKFREKGNARFKKLLIYDAILSYNKSICYAQSGACLALAYGNRSAAYFEVKHYQECINNIKLARENGFPASKLARLDEREKKCLREIQKQADPNPLLDVWTYLKLSYPANKNIPWMIEGLEMRKTEQFGRGIYATRSLKAGDIVCVEEVKINVLNSRYKFCSNCAKMKKMDLIPCLKTARFMFCSGECRDEFCKYADLSSDTFDKMAFLLKKIEAAFDGVHNITAYLDSHSSTNIFDFDWSDTSQDYWLNLYKCFLAASHSSEGFPYLTDNRYKDMMKKLLYVVCGKMSGNSLTVQHFSHKGMTPEKCYNCPMNKTQDKISFSTFHGLLNHSCVPNIRFLAIENTAVFYVVKPIKAGEQLFTRYLGITSFVISDKNTRAKYLSKVGVHNCSCIACEKGLSNKDLKITDMFDHVTQSLMSSQEMWCCVANIMQSLSVVFDALNKYAYPTSCERILAENNATLFFDALVDRSTFPA